MQPPPTDFNAALAVHPPCRTDYLAAQAPSVVPGWFRAERPGPNTPEMPPTVLRWREAEERHREEFDCRTPSEPDADWHERRSASANVVNSLYRLAKGDLESHERACQKAATVHEVRLLTEWRYWWAALQIRTLAGLAGGISASAAQAMGHQTAPTARVR